MAPHQACLSRTGKEQIAMQKCFTKRDVNDGTGETPACHFAVSVVNDGTDRV